MRRRAGLTQPELAKLLNVSKGAVGNWETSAGELPQPDNLRKIAEFFGEDVAYLTGDDTVSILREGPPDGILEQIRRHVDELIHACRGIDRRLHWVLDELQTKLPTNRWIREDAKDDTLSATGPDDDRTLKQQQAVGVALLGAKAALEELGLKPQAASPSGNKSAPPHPAPPAKDAPQFPPAPAPAGSSPSPARQP